MHNIGKQVFCQELAPYVPSEETDPLIELTGFALNYYPELATQLLRKAKTLPDKLFEKLV